MEENEAIKRINIVGTSHKSTTEIRKLPNRRYEIILFIEDQMILQKKLIEPENDKIVDLLAASDLDFISFSAISNTANEIDNIIRVMKILDVVAEEYMDVSVTPKTPMEETLVEKIESEENKLEISDPGDTVLLELPMTAGAVAEIRFMGGEIFEINFYQDNSKIYSETVSQPDNEGLLNILAASKVDFISLSAIGLAADSLEEKINMFIKGARSSSGIRVESEGITVDKLEMSDSLISSVDDSIPMEGVSTEAPDDDSIFLTEVKVPYSPGSIIIVYKKGSDYKLSFKQDGKFLSSTDIKSDITEDDLTIVISNSNLTFIGMTVILDCAEGVLAVIQDPDKFLQVDKDTEADQSLGDIEETSAGESIETIEEDINLEEFRSPTDIETLISALKKSVDQNRPTLMKEIEIKVKTKGVTAKILRQGEDSWFIHIYQKNEPVSNMMKLNSVDHDEVFRVLNNGVPQTSLSELASAAESAFADLKLLASQTQDDLILTQVVNHFSAIIDKHEEEGDLEEASKLSKSLLEKFKELNNSEGISKFGQKTAQYYERQDRISESAQLRINLVDYFLANLQNLHEAREFVDNTLDFLINDPLNQYMDAAELCVKFTESCIERKNYVLGIDYALKSSTFYKKAELPIALTDTCFKYGKDFLDMAFEKAEEKDTIIKEASIEETEEKDISEDKVEQPSSRKKFIQGGGLHPPSIKRRKSRKKEEPRKRKRAKETAEDSPIDDREREENKRKIIIGVVKLFNAALEAHELRKDKYELIEGVTNIIIWMREKELVEEEITFSEKAINYFEDFNLDDRSLKLSLQLVDKLFDSDDTDQYTKGLHYTNSILKTYMENDKLKSLESAVEFALKITSRLIELNQREAAVGYLNFIKDLIPRAADSKSKIGQRLKYIMLLSSSYQKLQMSDESLAGIKNALDIVKDQGSDDFISFVRQNTNEFLDEEQLQPAHDLINTAITLVGQSGDIKTVIDISNNFADDLFPSKNYQLALDYVNYAYTQSRLLQDVDPNDAIGKIKHFIGKYLDGKDVENVTDYVNQLIPVVIQYYQYTKEYEEIIGPLTGMIDKLVDRGGFRDTARYSKDLAGFYAAKNDFQGAVDILMKYRDKYLSIPETLSEAKDITDIALNWCVNQLKDHSTAIKMTESLAKELIKNDQYEDAYIYTIQCAKYFEEENDIDGAKGFLNSIRGEYGNNHEYIERVGDFTIRLVKSYDRLQEAVDISREYFSYFITEKDEERATKFLDSVIRLLVSQDRQEEALNLINETKQELMSSKSPYIETLVDKEVQIIKDWRSKYKEWKAEEIVKELLIKTAKLTLESNLTAVADRLMTRCVVQAKNNDTLTVLIPVLEEWVQQLTNLEEYDIINAYVIEIINSAFKTEDIDIAQNIAFKYIVDYLDHGQVDRGAELVENTINRTVDDTVQSTKLTLRFVKLLVERRLVSNARKYVDRTISIFTKPASPKSDIFTAAKICEKFALLVLSVSHALSLEYIYKAGDYYKRIGEYDPIISLFKDTSVKLGGKTGAKVIKRGLFIIEGKISEKTVELHRIYVRLLIESKERESKIKIGIQKLLEVAEALDSLETLVDVMNGVIIDLAKSACYFDVLMVYFDYLVSLVGMVGKSTGLKTVFSVTKDYFQSTGNSDAVKKIEEAYGTLNEPEPSEKDIREFVTGREVEDIVTEKIEPVAIIDPVLASKEEISEELQLDQEIESAEIIQVDSVDRDPEKSPDEALGSLLELEETEEEEKEFSPQEDLDVQLVGGSLKDLSIEEMRDDVSDEGDDVFTPKKGFLDVEGIIQDVIQDEDDFHIERIATDDPDEEIPASRPDDKIGDKSDSIYKAISEDEEDFDEEFGITLPSTDDKRKEETIKDAIIVKEIEKETEPQDTSSETSDTIEEDENNQMRFSTALDDLAGLDFDSKDKKKKK